MMMDAYLEGEDAFAGGDHEGDSGLSLVMGLVAGVAGVAVAPVVLFRALTAGPVVLSTERTLTALSAIWPALPPIEPEQHRLAA